MKITNLSQDELYAWLRTQASLLGVNPEQYDYLTLIEMVYDGVKCGRLATPYFVDEKEPVITNKVYSDEEMDEQLNSIFG